MKADLYNRQLILGSALVLSGLVHNFEAEAFPSVNFFLPVQNRVQANVVIRNLSSKGKYGPNQDDVALGEHLSTNTHLIAVPLEENKEFMIELESVQRAVLYDCPLLIRAVVAPSSTKLPLLLVNTQPDSLGNNGNSIPGFNTGKTIYQSEQIEKATSEINDIVTNVVKELIYDRRSDDSEGDGDSSDETPEPVMISFAGLEIEGSLANGDVEHEVLYSIGKEGTGDMNLMRRVVNEIQSRIEAQGWTATFLPYRPQGAESAHLDDIDMSDMNDDKWRARIPFMRLPRDFEENLPPVKEGLFGSDIRSPDEGGDGISPLFWFPYRFDEFTPKKSGTRLREIAVYARTAPSFGYDEYSFYVPRASTPLPDTNSKEVAKTEAEAKAYDDERQEENNRADREAWEASKIQWDKAKSNSDTNEDDGGVSVDPQSFIKSVMSSEKFQRTGGHPTEPKPIVRQYDEFIDNEEDYNGSSLRKNVRSAANKSQRSMNVEEPSSLPPYPADEYFLGIWRMVTSPLPQEPGDPDVDIYDCDNLILRVDGTIAGGPIFDSKLQLRAAGGTWRMFQAKYVGEGDSNGEVQTRLRMELVVPPRKDKLLIMEGRVTRMSIGPGSGLASVGAIRNMEEETILACSGESYVQDIEGIRTKAGLFSIRKIPTPAKVEYGFPVAPPSGLQ